MTFVKAHASGQHKWTRGLSSGFEMFWFLAHFQCKPFFFFCFWFIAALCLRFSDSENTRVISCILSVKAAEILMTIKGCPASSDGRLFIRFLSSFSSSVIPRRFSLWSRNIPTPCSSAYAHCVLFSRLNVLLLFQFCYYTSSLNWTFLQSHEKTDLTFVAWWTDTLAAVSSGLLGTALNRCRRGFGLCAHKWSWHFMAGVVQWVIEGH